MTSLVLELQQEARDPSVRVDNLLLKAVVVATTLGIDDFRAWAEKELQGYAGDHNSCVSPGDRTSQGISPLPRLNP